MTKKIKLDEEEKIKLDLDLIKDFKIVKIDIEIKVDWIKLSNKNPSKISERYRQLRNYSKNDRVSIYGLPERKKSDPSYYNNKWEWEYSDRLQIQFLNGSKLFFFVDHNDILSIRNVINTAEAMENFKYLKDNLFY